MAVGGVQAGGLAMLLEVLDRGFNRRCWHGPNLRGAIRGLSASQAAWRPSPRRHAIAEHVVHAAYWKYIVRRRLGGEKRGTFALAGSNWFPLEQPWNDAAWRRVVRVLEDEHARLRLAVTGCCRLDLAQRLRGSRTTPLELIAGIAAHDVYHAGQIQLLKRLQADV